MNMIFRSIAALVVVPAVFACAPSGNQPSEPAAPKQVAAPEKAPLPVIEPMPDVDPATGIDRNVTYEPQLTPEPQERTRKDDGKSPPRGQ